MSTNTLSLVPLKQATRVLQDLGFVPQETSRHVKVQMSYCCSSRNDSAYPSAMVDGSPGRTPPAALVGDYVDKCMVGIVPVDALAPRAECAVLVTDEQVRKCGGSARNRRGGLARLEYVVCFEDQPPEDDYEPDLTEEDLLDEAVHLRHIEDADDPGDREEALREYGLLEGRRLRGLPKTTTTLWRTRMLRGLGRSLLCRQPFSFLHGSPSKWTRRYEYHAGRSDRIQERLGKRSEDELHEGLSAALTTEWLLLLAEHRGDWSAAALGYFKCLERVLAASLRSACGAEPMPRRSRKGGWGRV
jgi:hypothetical protein